MCVSLSLSILRRTKSCNGGRRHSAAATAPGTHKYLLFCYHNDAHFLLFSLVLVYLYRNKRKGRLGIDKEEYSEGKDENNGDNEAYAEVADDKTDEAEGQEDGRGGGG